jgi:hypothetical protein
MSILRKFLERLSTRLEERRIEVNGELYLQRYYLWGRMPPELAALWNCGKTPKPRLRWLPTVYLHRFHMPDPDRYCHNHPWWGKGMVLTGGYQELRLVNDPEKDDHFDYRVRTLRPGQVQLVTPKTFHRVQKLHADQVWTVFMVGKRVQRWGYNIPGRGFVPYNEVHADPNNDAGATS